MPLKTSRKTINVALVLYDHMLATSVSLPIEMLRAGEAFARREDRQSPKLSIEMVSELLAPVRTRALIKLYWWWYRGLFYC